jgi:single-strand DNA-binding protein
MACSGRRFDRGVGDYVNTDPVYISVVCWRQLGDNVMQSLRKGDTVVVFGRLTFHEWTDQQGGKHNRYEVDASSVGPDLSRYVAQLGRPLRELPDPAEQVPSQPPQPATDRDGELDRESETAAA